MYYPIFLNIEGKHCLVIGGGKVAERKILGLLEAGAVVTVISPKMSENIIKLSKKRVNSKKLVLIKENYSKNTIKESKIQFSLIISATNSKKINELAYLEANKLNIMVNVVDKPELCSFILPARVVRGDFQIAISTGGKSPYFAKTLKGLFEEDLPKEFGIYIDLIGAVRYKLLKKKTKNGYNSKLTNNKTFDSIFDAIIDSDLLDWVIEAKRVKKSANSESREAVKKINKFLKSLLGPGYSLSSLGIKF